VLTDELLGVVAPDTIRVVLGVEQRADRSCRSDRHADGRRVDLVEGDHLDALVEGFEPHG
jgi:hypothetical protein